MVRNTNRTDREDLMKTNLAEFTILWKYHHFAFLLFQGLNKYICVLLYGSNETASSLEGVPNYSNASGIN